MKRGIKLSTKFICKALMECQNEKHLTALYLGDDFESYNAGYIEAVTENDVLFRERRQNGILEGWIAVPIEAINKIEMGTSDLKAVEVYSQSLNEIYEETFFKGDTPKRKHSIMEIVSDYLLHSGEVTTIELLCGEEYLNGIVVEDDLFGLKLEVYTDEGSPDGVAWIKKEDITGIRFGGKSEKIIKNFMTSEGK